jgi:hypothetical protein
MAVDFTIVDPFGEQEDVRGRVGFGGASVILEIEALKGKGVWRKVVIGVEEFSLCRFRRGILGARLSLRTADEGALGGVPGVVDDSVTLQFARHDRQAAAALADRLATAIADLSARSSSVRVFDWSSSSG